ncbi:uncharacterized protein TRIADDRAFT_59578 [Trichoplax adhaerens]|uniref:Uncharacterized protein n=1 Tax=Trichoplax adhaerens TaxID=10228 RepID=B3S617_TRIAD|nr:hypothetical protein TRIADDRAFT_59578 [Trichoplax adhaerens]EDV22016.1 hypothetical protein TRIADDRAFT_59578 [Trichoplax adhaerens]|eukprot:XP_002115653.1 hypothetical protein TRIADDRAFT_59578 [Trichoplax adhaerens]
MANMQEKKEWPEDFDNISQFKNGPKIKQFLITFIQKFTIKLKVLSQVLEKEIKLKPGMIANTATQFLTGILSCLQFVPTDGPFNLVQGMSLIQTLISEIAERYDRRSIKKIIDHLTPNNDRVELAISMIACDLVRIYEQQISIISDAYDNHYIKKLAEDMIEAIIAYIIEQKDKPPKEPLSFAKFISKCIIEPNFVIKHSTTNSDRQGKQLAKVDDKKEGLRAVTTEKYSRYKGKKGSKLKIALKENEELSKIYSSDLVLNTGIRIEVDNSFKYYDLKRYEKTDHYGFRQLSFFHDGNSRDFICGLNDITQQIMSSPQMLFNYQSKLSGNLDREFFISYAQQVLNAALLKDKEEVSATINDDQISTITRLLTENISNLIKDQMDQFKDLINQCLDERRFSDMEKMITKFQNMITDEEFISTNSNDQRYWKSINALLQESNAFLQKADEIKMSQDKSLKCQKDIKRQLDCIQYDISNMKQNQFIIQQTVEDLPVNQLLMQKNPTTTIDHEGFQSANSKPPDENTSQDSDCQDHETTNKAHVKGELYSYFTTY